jgi:hypothetical protein
MATQLKNSLTITGGTGVTASNSGVAFDGTEQIVQEISVGNDIRTTGNVQFNAVTSSAGYDLGGFTLLTDRWESNFNAGGNMVVTGNLTIPGNASVGVNVTAEKIASELTSSGTIFQSGSTQFGDTIDDTHYMTGSVYQSGSFSLLGSNITEISNDTTLADGSSTALTTENASKAYIVSEIGSSGEPTTIDVYLRKSYNKTASSISNNTASFSAFSASAGSLTATNENDFIFFNNGQVIEQDALTIQQNSSTFMMISDPSSLGYNLDSSDEIKAWGKFEPVGYLDFDGENDEVTTNYSGSALPGNKTYSWWMKSSETARNYAVFGYGSNKTAFVPNFSGGKPLMWNGASWFVYWDATEDDNDGEWHHWMLYNDVAAITGSKLYVDGTLLDVSSYHSTGTLLTHSQPLTIGSYRNNSTTAGHHFTGSIKEFSVFPGDKTSNASTYYNNGIPYDVTNEADLQGYWRMDEYSGSIAYDSSGEGNHGTVDGATWNT